VSPGGSTVDRPLRWPLVQQPANRSESWLKDARLVNAFAEKDPNTQEWWVQKRIGYTSSYSVARGTGRGMYPFGSSAGKDTYSIFSGGFPTPVASMYKNGTLFGVDGGLDAVGTNGGMYAFVEDQASPNHLVFASLTNIYYTTGTGGWTQASLPPHGSSVRGLAYLDQTIYFMDEKGQIFGSAFNNPASWNALNVVIANARYGVGVQLVQQLNYVIALKTNSMEVFYDPGTNPPPSSPLSPLPGAISPYGAVDGTPQVIDDILIYATSDNTVSPQMVRVDNLQTNIISTPAIERLLDAIQATPNVTSSWTFKHGGHRFYGLAFKVFNGGFTIVYDIDQNLWYQWTDSAGNHWPVVAMAYDNQFRHVLQGEMDSTVYIFEGDYEFPTDNGVVAPVEIITPNADFGTRRRKTLHRKYFHSDQTPGSVLYVSRSDDDYTSWSEPRRVDLGKKNPQMRNEGTFTRRAYRYRHVSPTALRIKTVDLQMDIGTI
jgi:hypothetical protein